MSDSIAVEIRRQIESAIALKVALLNSQDIIEGIEMLADRCLQSLRSGGKIIFAGNGGSFADAQHLSAEFVSRFKFDRAPLPAIALGTNSSTLSATGNDYGYSHVFSRELQAIARPGDIFVPISTSGNSENVLAAIEAARQGGVITVGLTGESGGRMVSMCDCICIPSSETARIQESHILVGHIVCGLVENAFFRNGEWA